MKAHKMGGEWGELTAVTPGLTGSTRRLAPAAPGGWVYSQLSTMNQSS